MTPEQIASEASAEARRKRSHVTLPQPGFALPPATHDETAPRALPVRGDRELMRDKVLRHAWRIAG